MVLTIWLSNLVYMAANPVFVLLLKVDVAYPLTVDTGLFKVPYLDAKLIVFHWVHYH